MPSIAADEATMPRTEDVPLHNAVTRRPMKVAQAGRKPL